VEPDAPDEFDFIEPGKPTQNAYIERFNGTFRRNMLDVYAFDNLDEARAIAQDWVQDYNHFRPHDSLQGMSPIQYLKKKKGC
jgi:putative transposase